MRLTRRSVNMGLAASLATPAFSRVARAGGDTIKIGMVLSVTGPGADSGKYALTGAKIALDRVNKCGRRARQTGRTRHRGRSDDQSGRRARLLQARRAAGHRRLPRPDPVDAEPRDGARYPEDGQSPSASAAPIPR